MAGCMLGTDDDADVPWEKQAAHGSPGQHALADEESPRLNTASSIQRKDDDGRRRRRESARQLETAAAKITLHLAQQQSLPLIA